MLEGPSLMRTYNRTLSSPITLHTIDFPIIHLDDEEYRGMVTRYNQHTKGVQLDERTCDYIRSFLGGHIGLVAHLLDFLDTSLDSHNLRVRAAPASQIEVLDYIIGIAFQELSGMHSMPTIGYLEASSVPHLLEITRLLLLNGGSLDKSWLKFNEHNAEAAAIACLLTTHCIASNHESWAFASPFIRSQLSRWRNPVSPLPDFHEFVRHSVRSLDYAGIGVRISLLQDGLVHEDPIKCALYAMMPSYLPLQQQVDPEVGRFFGPRGRVDLWIRPANWAIEIWRDYNAVQNDVDRRSSTAHSSLPVERHVVLNFVQERDCSLQRLTKRGVSLQEQQEQQDRRDVWHVHWSPRARGVVLRRNTGDEERLPVHETPL
ncbi:hypothetical protein C0992_007054 [Termitomyces sp. T32_za158]|nr:hypothetical protein C0992_007054 [Termitomyces sp. T32_za158]